MQVSLETEVGSGLLDSVSTSQDSSNHVWASSLDPARERDVPLSRRRQHQEGTDPSSLEHLMHHCPAAVRRASPAPPGNHVARGFPLPVPIIRSYHENGRDPRPHRPMGDSSTNSSPLSAS